MFWKFERPLAEGGNAVSQAAQRLRKVFAAGREKGQKTQGVKKGSQEANSFLRAWAWTKPALS